MPIRVFGICLVRNEQEILPVSLAHHLALGFARIIVGDNDSSDGTSDLLRALELEQPIERVALPGPFFEAAQRTQLARLAAAQGADWVFPFDADEFWQVPQPLGPWLDGCGADVLQVQVQFFVQARKHLVWRPEVLLDMTRVPVTLSPATADTRHAVESERTSALERVPLPKVAFRAATSVEVAAGSHAVRNAGTRTLAPEGFRILHAPYYARSRLQAKVETGRRAVDASPDMPSQSWHLKRLLRVHEAGRLEQEWRSCSYEHNLLDVYGISHPVREDLALRRLLAPLLGDIDSN